METLLVIILVAGLAAVGVAATTAIVVFRRRGRERRAELASQAEARFAELTRDAGAALMRADERLRLATDDLEFAKADFGASATTDFDAAIRAARESLSEAFHLNQLLSDHVPDTDAQRDEWTQRIIAMSGAIDTDLSRQQASFSQRRLEAKRTPDRIVAVRRDIERVRSAIPAASETIDRLSLRYSDAALAPISGNADQALHLLDFAERSAQVAESRLGSGRDDEALATVGASAETTSRAEGLLDAVERFEVEAISAEATLADMIAESRQELAVARALPAVERRSGIDNAIAALDRALRDLPARNAPQDPIGSLSAVRQANTALDDAMAERENRAERAARLRAAYATARDDASQQIAAARNIINDYSAPVGADARTRLAEAERDLVTADDLRDNDPEAALSTVRRSASRASEAANLAHADIQRAQQQAQYQQQQQYGGGYGRGGYGGGYGRGGGGSGMLGGVIGGLAIGGLLEGLGDMGDMFD
ncbi:hypothetical protein [Marisediminicola senii]|uniref:hypothetical protein n=1 Tax=Marisediminicola senii TaxID=2711233 RepID=UPI0013ED94C3|nr:hypothetical protein [Marisediminicola senii]